MERKLKARKSLDDRNFAVRSHAGNAGHLEVGSDSASLRIGQRIRREGREEMWDALLVECKSQEDGTLTVEVVICHPDWDEPLRIASIESNPADANAGESTLRCDFHRKRL